MAGDRRAGGCRVLIPALYRTRVWHHRAAPVEYSFRHRGYCWYVDVDDLPRLPRWLRPFARIDPRDHLDGQPGDSLRDRVDAVLASRGLSASAGSVTALLQARVLGYVFNPLSLYWCHDADGTVQHVIAEVHNTYGGRHAYVASGDGQLATVSKAFYVSPFNDVSGRYLINAPRPDKTLEVTITLLRDDQPPFVAALRGDQLPVSTAQLLRLQLIAPIAPLRGALAIRRHGIALWLHKIPVVPRQEKAELR
ncbi:MULTISPECIES: DUF1365 domain-containing protein [unclassified Mycolicibacterium]|uniref:DUF1365 domain-containing protein n=1 Tax=unclassified Mycolicibacterium TaxID=2636767 RepID=UPI0016119604|nr:MULTISPECIES: DUF1365 family protein [unclassified Mycolicibacterium]